MAAAALMSAILLAGALIVATEATAPASRNLGIAAILLGAVMLGGGVTALVWACADADDRQ